MTDAYLRSDPPSAAEMERLRYDVLAAMRPFFDSLPTSPARMLAVAGTATSVVSISKHMEAYDPDKVHGTVVSPAMLESVTTLLCNLTTEGRRHVTGLDPGRAGVIVAGLIILGCVFELADLPSFTVSESDILQGILLDAAH